MNSHARRLTVVSLACVSLLFLAAVPAAAQVSLTTLGSAYTQNFDTLPATGSATWVNNPAGALLGWYSVRTGTGTTIAADTGTSTGGNLYSYGAAAVAERALGTIGSGNATAGSFFHGVRLLNNTGSTINSLTVTYTGEQWRNSAAAAHTAAFSYLVGSPTVTGTLAEFQTTGVAVTPLDFTSPITGGTAGALNGNLAANRTVKSYSINGLSIPNGTEIMLRWSDPDQTGGDHGLAIDDFSVTPSAGPGTPNLSIDNVSQAEGDAGTSTFTFTVSLDIPAGAGGVTFDIATADGTATVAGSDYVANSLTGQTIAAGNSTYSFAVTVNGDVTVEPSETFFVNVTNVVGAGVADGQGLGTIIGDDGPLTLIHTIQGTGSASGMAGSIVAIDGIVVGSYQGAAGLGGFFVQEEDGDKDVDPLTSEGIFVFSSAVPVAVGDHVHVVGTVVEFGTAPNTLTELSPVGSISVLGSGALPAVAEVTLPASPDPLTAWERFEGMRVHFAQALAITDTFSMASYGEIGLSSGGRLLQPTNTVDPNDAVASGTTYVGPWTNSATVTTAQTANNNNLITLDDGKGGSNVSPEFFNPAGGATRLGNTITGMTGVMTHQFGLYMVQPLAPVVFTAANPRTGPPSVGSPAIKVSFHNTLNFFVNTGTGRGAANATEFTRQRDKLVAALAGIGADVIGLSELEKDPTALDAAKPDNASAASLAAGLTTVTGHAWAAIVDPWTCETDYAPWPCNIGTDPDIKDGIIYDTTKVTPVGGSFTDLVAASGAYSRAPYAQIFTINATGGKFGLVVNHLRSKGCSGGTGLDADQGDGQGCYNNRRMLQAVATSNFVATNAGFAGVPNVLVMGDMNAYGEEDPIDAFRANGMVDLIGADTSYNFSGQSGHIDHALCTAAMASFVTGAGVWHVNADEPVVTDYVMTGKPADAPYAADAYRSSDHDPLLVGIMGTVPVTLMSFEVD